MQQIIVINKINRLRTWQQASCNNQQYQMSGYFHKIIKKDLYPVHHSELSFKTSFENCILTALQGRKYKQTTEDDWNIYWIEKEFVNETLNLIKGNANSQKINHFRNYQEICRKDLLIKNLKRHKRQLEKQKSTEAADYNFFPTTYNLPADYYFFKDQYTKLKQREKAVWIMKPIGKAQGKGIFLFKDIVDIEDWKDSPEDCEPYIVQRYIMNPLIIGGKKFDMRIYVLCISYQPLIIYLNRSGFARFTHSKYDLSDLKNVEGHLTNVAIQKQSQNYDEERGGKWLLDKLRQFLTSRYGPAKVDDCFCKIQKLIIKTLSAGSQIIVHDKRCFALYGFDVLLDQDLRPWLLEVNGSPSMTSNTKEDKDLKVGVLDDVFTILNLEKLLTGDEEQVGGFDLIYKGKPIKKTELSNDYSMLGCLNDRQSNLKKLAKMVVTRMTRADETDDKKDKLGRNQSIQTKKPWGANNPNPKAMSSLKTNMVKVPVEVKKGTTNFSISSRQTNVRFPQIKNKLDAKSDIRKTQQSQNSTLPPRAKRQ